MTACPRRPLEWFQEWLSYFEMAQKAKMQTKMQTEEKTMREEEVEAKEETIFKSVFI